jgi:hypothetical protein
MGEDYGHGELVLLWRVAIRRLLHSFIAHVSIHAHAACIVRVVCVGGWLAGWLGIRCHLEGECERDVVGTDHTCIFIHRENADLLRDTRAIASC